MRWLIALIVVLAVSPATAGVFKQRDKNRTRRPPPPAVVEKAAPAKADKAEAPKKAAPQPKSAVATKGRPDDLTPKPKAKAKAKPKKDGDVVIVEDKEEDVIVKDDD